MESSRKIENKLAESHARASSVSFPSYDKVVISNLRKYKNNYKLLKKYLLDLNQPLTKEILLLDLGKNYLLFHFLFSDAELCKVVFLLAPPDILSEVLLEQAASGFNGLHILLSAEKDNKLYSASESWQVKKEKEAATEKALLMRVMRGEVSPHLLPKIKDDSLFVELITLLSAKVINQLVLLTVSKTNILHIMLQQDKSEKLVDTLVPKLEKNTLNDLLFMPDQFGIIPLGYACFPSKIAPNSFIQSDSYESSCNMSGTYLLKYLQPEVISKQISLLAASKSTNPMLADKSLLDCLSTYNVKLNNLLMRKSKEIEWISESKNESKDINKSVLPFK